MYHILIMHESESGNNNHADLCEFHMIYTQKVYLPIVCNTIWRFYSWINNVKEKFSL